MTRCHVDGETVLHFECLFVFCDDEHLQFCNEQIPRKYPFSIIAGTALLIWVDMLGTSSASVLMAGSCGWEDLAISQVDH